MPAARCRRDTRLRAVGTGSLGATSPAARHVRSRCLKPVPAKEGRGRSLSRCRHPAARAPALTGREPIPREASSSSPTPLHRIREGRAPRRARGGPPLVAPPPALRPRPLVVSYQAVACSRHRPTRRRDSALGVGSGRCGAAEASSARAGRRSSTTRLVNVSPLDRTSAALHPPRLLIGARGAVRTCTIPPREEEIQITTAPAMSPAPDVPPFDYLRYPKSVESRRFRPGGHDEARNSHQRQPARDAGRHPRGRPAR